MNLLRAWFEDILHNLDSLLLAFFLAVIVWVIAVQQEDPIVVADLADPVPVSYVNLAPDLTVLGEPVSAVHLRVRGQRSVISSLGPASFRAVVDLGGLTPDVHTLPIQVEGPREVQVVAVDPPRAVVHIERLVQKEVPVRVEVMDLPPLGFQVRQDGITTEPMTVTVSGPESQVEKVVAAVAEVYVQAQRSSVNTSVVLSARDAGDLPVFNVNVEPPVAQVVVPVEPQPGFAEVPVVPRTVGQPAEGYRVASISVDPATVTLRGSPDMLQRMPGYVETEPLDISGATQDVVERLPLRIPQNLSIIGPKTAIVTVRIAALEGGRTLVRVLKIQGMPDGVQVTVPIRSVQVVLSGPLPKLNNLKGDEVQAILDLSAISGEGVFTVKPQILTPSDIRVEAVIPAEVQVEVRRPTPTPTPTSTPTPTPTSTPLLTPTPTRSGLSPAPLPTPTLTATVTSRR